MQFNTGQKALAEFVGTFALVFIGAGSFVAVVSALGGVDGGGLVAVALAYGLVVAAMVSAVGHISGGHLNPAVTIGAFVTGRIDLRNGAAYLAAQLAGAVAAAGLLRAAVPRALWDTVELGTPAVNEALGLSSGQAVLIEAVLTFFLVWAIFAMAVDVDGSFRTIAGVGIGFVVVVGVLMGAPFTGGALNPARALGPAVIAGYWDHHWVYWVGPVAGGIVAAVAYDLAVLRPREEAATASS